MYILSLAIKNLLRNKRKTFVLALLITIVSSLVFVANAIFEQTNTGLRNLFSNYLTADYLISENSEKINSIFGYEMPLVAEYEPVKQLQAFLPISEKLDKHSNLLHYTPIISAAARLEMGSVKRTVPLFGIDSKSYFTVFPDISVPTNALSLLEAGNGGVVLSATLVESLEKQLKRPLKIGENIQFSAYTDGSFRIRKGLYAGSFEYPSTSDPFSRIILADPQLVRELLQYTNAEDIIEVSVEDDMLFSDSFDDLFFDAGDDVEDSEFESIFNSIDSFFETTDSEEIDYDAIITWSFILVRAHENISLSKVSNVLERDVLVDTDVKLMNWGTASGLSAQAPLALQISFNIGMAFIILGSVLVIMNGLVISVLERTNEIGTMRAMGASKTFIKKLYATEMMLLILFFSIIGIALGIIICVIIQVNPIMLHNSFLITLFGSEVLRPLISVPLILIQLGVSLAIALLSWQYPVNIAMSIQPAHSMGKGL